MPTVVNPTAKTVLTSEFWTSLGVKFSEASRADIGNNISNHYEDFVLFTKITYGELPFMDDLADCTNSEIVSMVYTMIGNAFIGVYDAFMKQYDPLENYFTDREFSESGEGSTIKTGDVETKPTGSITVLSNGSRDVDSENNFSVNQGTTYDDASTDPEGTEFVNISKHVNDTHTSENFRNYGTTTSYQNYTNRVSYEDVTDTAETSKNGEEHRSGSSGIFSKQDLIQREINLRLKAKVMPILVRMVVDVLNKGVW